MDSQRQAYWNRQAGRVARIHNFAWWLAAFLNSALFVCLAFACAVLVFRRSGFVPPALWAIFGSLLVICGAAALWRARSHRFSRRDALVQLDVQMKLHNRLTAAAAGVGDYPPERPVDHGVAWRWRRIFGPLAGGVALILTAIWIPLGSQVASTGSVEIPPALAQVETWIERLEEEKLVDSQKLEETRAKLEALINRPQEEWYGHEGLEAAAHLREQTAQSIQSLQRDMQTAMSALAALQEFGETLSPSAIENIDRALAEAIQGLELGTLPLDKDLLANLKSVDARNLRTLTPEQLEAMQRRLKEGTGVCQTCVGVCVGEGEFAMADPDGPFFRISRGPGSVPLSLNAERTELGSTEVEGIGTGDLSRALPGEVAGLATGEHEVDESAYRGPVAAGAVGSTGEGGDAVWSNSLTPAERETLQKFFQ
jgi:Zn-ribbon protein, possibly nucleic acid-binding